MASQDEDNDLPGSTPAPPPEKKPVPPPAAETSAAPVVSTPAAPKHVHSAYLTRRALAAGFSQADLDENDSSFIQSEIQRMHDWHMAERAKNAPAPQSAPAAPEKDPLDEITDDVFDPRMVAVAKTAKELRETVKAQSEQLKQFTEREQQRAQTTVVETIDGVFAGLDPKLYGAGDAAQLPKGSAEIQRRFAVVRAAGLANTDSPRAIANKLQAAHALLYPSVPVAPPAPGDAYAAQAGSAAKKPVPPKDPVTGQFVAPERITPEQWADAGLARPASRNGAPEAKGVHAAKAAVAQRMREQGFEPGHLSEANEDDDLPV